MEVLGVKVPHHLLCPRKGLGQHSLAVQFPSHSLHREEFVTLELVFFGTRTSAGTGRSYSAVLNKTYCLPEITTEFQDEQAGMK